MPNHLVIVESKAKAETIGKYLGSDYTVMASYGHVRDLPEKGLGIDVDDHFAVEWALPQDRAKKVVADIKRAMKGADTLYLATDEDREGESIAWHLLELLQPKGVEVHRMVFHEITEDAINEALVNTRQIDMRLVEAADGRRIMDRLVGYLVSPVLWRRVPSARSAGRVQSPAVRLVVERERARMKFVAAQYCDLSAIMNAATGDDSRSFAARLVEVADQPIATGKDFDADTGLLLESSKARQLNDAEADALVGALEGAVYRVTSADTRPFTEKPKEPFRTSTLQQEAGNKLGFSAGRTMSIAQGLYERGFITYMRTDSANLSEQAITAARIQVEELYGKQFVPAEPRRYKSGRNAQEAHEAIRPSGERFRVPASVRSELSNDEMRLYELIWMRTLASQMENARGNTATLRIGAEAGDEAVVFRASGKTYSFLGFRAAYIDVSEDDPSSNGEEAEAEAVLPVLAVGDLVNCSVLEVSPHSTKPPARFTEASLVKELESRGIGRPSTYASIIDKISSTRGYVYKQGNALVPSWTAFAKTQCLEAHFANLVDYRFTATMEEVLDKVAAGEAEAEKWLDEFYFGRDSPGLKQLVSQENLDTIKMEVVNSVFIGNDSEGIPITIRVWKNGASLHRGEEEKCTMPEGVLPDDLTVDRALEILAKGTIGPRELGIDPETGLTIIVLTGRFGPFVQVGILEPGTKSKEKPKRASLFNGMDPETITFEEALELLSLPRTVGEINGEEVTAQSGRYGPYLKKGTDSRTIGSEAQLLTITIEEAAAIYSQPKQARGRVSKPPLAALGAHPETGAPIVVKDGRFGPYITDGATNATVPRGIDPAEVTLETAVQLLAERAARVDSNPKRTIKKKAVKKKAVKKKAVKKKAVKKKAVAKKAIVVKVVKPAKKVGAKMAVKKAVEKATLELDGGSSKD